MTIVSISLPEKFLKEIDEIADDMGFAGRSEVIRTGLRLLLDEKKAKEKLKGEIDAILLVIHDDKFSKNITEIHHRHDDIVKTQLHNHLENNKCFQVFLLKGEAKNIVRLSEEFQTSRKTDTVKLIVS